jgi:hypothetical protein
LGSSINLLQYPLGPLLEEVFGQGASYLNGVFQRAVALTEKHRLPIGMPYHASKPILTIL